MIRQAKDQLNISLYDNDLEQVKSAPYLGVTLDQCFTWRDQIDKACKVLSFKVSRLSRLRKVAPVKIAHQMYNCIIQPSFDYAITVWGNATQQNVNKIQRIQNPAARIIYNNFDYVNHRGIDLVHKLGWMDIQQRFKYI